MTTKNEAITVGYSTRLQAVNEAITVGYSTRASGSE